MKEGNNGSLISLPQGNPAPKRDNFTDFSRERGGIIYCPIPPFLDYISEFERWMELALIQKCQWKLENEVQEKEMRPQG